MWFEFIIFKLYLLGEASLGLPANKVPAGDPNLSRAKKPAPPCLHSCWKDYVDGNKEGKMEGGPGVRLMWAGLRVCVLWVRGWGPDLLRLLDS